MKTDAVVYRLRLQPNLDPVDPLDPLLHRNARARVSNQRDQDRSDDFEEDSVQGQASEFELMNLSSS